MSRDAPGATRHSKGTWSLPKLGVLGVSQNWGYLFEGPFKRDIGVIEYKGYIGFRD